MEDLPAMLEALKGFGGYANTIATVLVAALAWWKGLPAIIEAGAKIIEMWSNRAASIEERLQTAMKLSLERNDLELERMSKRADEMETRYNESEKRHNDCEERNRKLSRAFDTLRDEMDIVKQDLTGAKRQLAAYEARGGAPVPVTGAIFLAPRSTEAS